MTTDPSLNLLAARQLGMGGLTVSFAGDAAGVFANPAGLVGIEYPQIITSSRNITLDETQYLLAGWAVPTDLGVFGLGYASQGTGGSPATVLDPATGRVLQDPSQEAGSYASSVIAVSYAREIKAPVKLSVGGNLKFFNQALSGAGVADRGTGLGLDLGADCRVLPWLSASALLQNLAGSVNWSGSQDKVGGYYKFGAAANVLGTSESLYQYPQPLVAGLEIDLPGGVLASSNSLLYHLGCEYYPQKNITLRAGIDQEPAGSGLTLGIGLVNSGFRFDYAFVERPGLPGDNPHYFSLSYIGERALTYEHRLKGKRPHLKFIFPYDRLITDKDALPVRAEVWADRIVAQKRIWTVTGVSATYETVDLAVPEKLADAELDGRPLDQTGTIEVTEQLKFGRNVIALAAHTSPESFNGQAFDSQFGTAEAVVLRIVPFLDTPLGHWAIEPISLTGALGLSSGYPDNTFKPEKGITRAELVTLLVKSLGLPQETLDPLISAEVFKDVKPRSWATKYVAYGNSVKYVTGYPDGTFQPNKILNRAEGVAILARYAGLGASPETSAEAVPFPDLKAGFWADKYIGAAKQAGMLVFLQGKDFKPGDPLTRAEACEVLYRVPAVQKKVNEFWETGIISAGR